MPTLARKMLIGDELSSKIAASADALSTRKSRTLAAAGREVLWVAREEQPLRQLPYSGSRGMSWVTIVSSAGFWNAATPMSVGASSVSGVSGGVDVRRRAAL